MKVFWLFRSHGLFGLALAVGASAMIAADTASTPRPKQDAKGNPIRYAATGHVSNYDEANVGAYSLPDPLVMNSGKPVTDALTWTTIRRPELIALYEREIFGAVPAGAPKATFEVVSNDVAAMDGTAVRKHVVMRLGEGERAVKVNVVLLVPVKAAGPVPVVLHMLFNDPPGITPPPAAPTAEGKAAAPRRSVSDIGPVAEILARGYAYVALRYTEIQPDAATTFGSGVMALAYAAGQTKPSPGEWGTITAWAWGASRVLDYLETDRAVNAKRVALVGHSRLGKATLWAGARDTRFGAVFASCSGEMGASLTRRDFGESLDDVAASFPWWLVSTFPKYAGRWSELPVDSHTVIALNAPRPVFATGGTEDLWADPHGEFQALVAAGPVYRLLGKKDVGATMLPARDTPLIGGSLGFLYHTGKHTITDGDWKAFFEFVGRHFE